MTVQYYIRTVFAEFGHTIRPLLVEVDVKKEVLSLKIADID